MARVVVASGYRVSVNESEMVGTTTWRGSFVVTSYYDSDDTAVSNTITIQITDDYEIYLEQLIEKSLNDEDVEDVSITGLFGKEYDAFCDAL